MHVEPGTHFAQLSWQDPMGHLRIGGRSEDLLKYKRSSWRSLDLTMAKKKSRPTTKLSLSKASFTGSILTGKLLFLQEQRVSGAFDFKGSRVRGGTSSVLYLPQSNRYMREPLFVSYFRSLSMNDSRCAPNPSGAPTKVRVSFSSCLRALADRDSLSLSLTLSLPIRAQ